MVLKTETLARSVLKRLITQLAPKRLSQLRDLSKLLNKVKSIMNSDFIRSVLLFVGDRDH